MYLIGCDDVKIKIKDLTFVLVERLKWEWDMGYGILGLGIGMWASASPVDHLRHDEVEPRGGRVCVDRLTLSLREEHQITRPTLSPLFRIY